MRIRHKLHFDAQPTIPSQQLTRETEFYQLGGEEPPQPWDDIEAEYNRLGPLDPMDNPFAPHQDEHDQQDGAFDFPPEDPLPDNDGENEEPTPQEHTTG